MEYKDYYEILGVRRDADERAIKSAFRRLARQYHPDVNPGNLEAEERFKEINEAYEVLSDPKKRQKYDQLGSQYSHWQQSGGRPSDFDWTPWSSGAVPGEERVRVRYGSPEDLEDLFGGASPFSDFFSQIFGMKRGAPGEARPGGFEYEVPPRRRQGYERGADEVYPVEITLQEAYQGTTRVIQRDGRRIQVRIPRGARTGTRVRVAGKGGPGVAGGEPGDLYLDIQVSADPRFERREDDLYEDVSLDLYTAILGGSVQVPTLDGAVQLSIPAGTQNESLFRIQGKGMPRLRRPEERGDLYARIHVRLPTELTARQRDLFEQLRQQSVARHSEPAQGAGSE